MKLELKDPKYFWFEKFDVVYEGEVKNNLPHGKGKLIYEKSEHSPKLKQITFEGTFEEGKPISGKLCDLLGNTFDGKFTSYTTEDGAFVDGGGKIISKEGDVYTGGWYAGEKNGYGTMEYSDGRKFEGTWLDDCKDDGEMIFPDGAKYKGRFHQWTNVFDYGELIYPNGYRFVGSFKITDDKYVYYNCSGQIHNPNGDFQEGKIKLVTADFVNFDKLMWPMPSELIYPS